MIGKCDLCGAENQSLFLLGDDFVCHDCYEGEPSDELDDIDEGLLGDFDDLDDDIADLPKNVRGYYGIEDDDEDW